MCAAFMSCNSHDKMKNDAAEALAKANQSITTNHADSMSVKKAKEAIHTFVARFPEDSLSPSYLFELALLFEKQQQYDSTVKTLDKIYSGYPHSKQASKAVFLEGFLYANVLNQLDKAKNTYQLYLDNFSAVDAKMTNDVQMELQNLGKSPEEILKQIQDKVKVDSTKAPS